MESASGPRLGKLSSSGVPRGRHPKHGHAQDSIRTTPGPENHKHSPVCDDPGEGKRKGRPKAEAQELRSIPAHMIVQWKEEFKRRSRVKCPCSGCWLEFPSIYGVKYHYQRCQGATVAEKLSHGCPYCEAVFATKVRLQKHKLWNHPDRVSVEPKQALPKLQKISVKPSAKKRPMENNPPSPVFFKVKKTHEVSTPSQNGELPPQRSEKKQHVHSQPPQLIHQSQPVLPHSHRSQSQSTSSDAGGSDSEGGSLPPPFHDEDPERMRHRRKQKTPKKFTGEQPSISGTFGLKGMTKVEEKLKAGRVKRPEGSSLSEEQRRSNSGQPSKKDSAPPNSGPPLDAQWQHVISERGEVVCPTCSMVTRKTVSGLKKHMEICQKLQDALKCQQCHKQFRSKAGLNYHTMAEHSTKPSGSEGQTGDEQEERERLRRVLKQMGRIKCPSEGCSAHFSSLMGYQYHQKRCGRELSEDEKPVFLCQQCGKTYRSKAGRDYHVRTEHPPTTTTTTDNNNHKDNKDNATDTNNNTGKERVTSAETPLIGRKEKSQPERKEWQEKASAGRPMEKEREARQRESEREQDRERAARNDSLGEDFERTPSGRVRRRSAQVAVFHLQEIAEDELAKDWGTKRRIKDDLVPDSKRLNYTRPGLPNFSPELLETWKNEVKEKGFICCTNRNCEAVYSSVSGLKAHLANCSQGDGEMGKYTCLICQKEFSSESGVKYHISKTHSQNWFRAAASHVASSNKSKAMEDNGIKAEVRNGATTGRKRGRKPKERPLEVAPVQTKTPAPSATQNSAPSLIPSSAPTETLTQISSLTESGCPVQNRQSSTSTVRRSKPKRVSSSE
ncbi:LOW QUALITY PROTEIN: zinc finger protein 512B [Lampris incognitus]|uniref:LOW QUALITY PROTEIN: zinc finger protein 512B n=1 Tax=Lampris incognitus TaxID=2546036 RepID=UPI0024B5D973|nr:LOW QUALITY PROTEIN: zinc finger protein 512B [Lampris incognitus]